MFKKAMILLLSGCLSFFTGLPVLAANTTEFGGSPGQSAYANGFSIDATAPAASLGVDQDKSITGNTASDYKSHGRAYGHRRYGSWRAGSKEMMLFMLFGMIFIVVMLL